MRHPTLPTFVGIAILLGLSLRGQDVAPIRYVDGRPMLKATLKAGEKTYFCHLLLDLTQDDALVLHRNAAGALHAREADIVLDGIRLEAVPLRGESNEWLEAITKRYATELQELPCAGFIGLSAFGKKVIQIDGPGKELRLFDSDPTAGGQIPAGMSRIPLVTEAGATGLVVLATGAEGHQARLQLDTHEPWSYVTKTWLDGRDAKTALATMRAGVVDFARLAPFRRVEEAALDGGLGGALLARMSITIDAGAHQITVKPADPKDYPADEAAFYDALDETGDAGLRSFATRFPQSRWIAEASQVLFDRAVGRSPADLVLAKEAAERLILATPVEGRATIALKLEKGLPAADESTPLRQALLESVVGVARNDQDGNAQHLIHLRLGQMQLAKGDDKGAYRNLLSAAFGMSGDGRPALALGQLHERLGQVERAWSRYVQALIDTKETGVDGLLALQAQWRKSHPDGGGFIAAITEATEGRAPAFHPLPRPPAESRPTADPVLVEIYTGANCPPCVAADLAFDALEEYFVPDREIITLAWHLPVPSPEPLITTPGMKRAREYEIRGTPTIVINGENPITGGGSADDAAKVFQKYRGAVESALQASRTAIPIQATVGWDEDAVTAQIEVDTAQPLRLYAVLVEQARVFPGRNGLIMHHQVVRGSFTGEDGAPVRHGATIALRLAMADLSASLDLALQQFEQEKPFRVRPTEPDRSELGVVIFLQDPSGAIRGARRYAVPPPAGGPK